jgi:autophagy-related protein 33
MVIYAYMLWQGVSYTLSTVTLPSLLFLPTAPSAAQTHAYLKQRSRRIQKILSALAISTLTLAYVFSPSRGKHPYLLWTSLVCGAGLAPGLSKLVGKYGGQEEQPLSGSRIEMEESGVIVTPPASGSESGDDDAAVINGEVVRRGVERGRVVEATRTGIFGLSFLMAVVGLWGDGA